MDSLSLDETRAILADSIHKLQSGELTAASANAIANLVGKGLYSYKLQLEYHKVLGKTPNLPQLGTSKTEE